jgi:hypothetical protein
MERIYLAAKSGIIDREDYTIQNRVLNEFPEDLDETLNAERWARGNPLLLRLKIVSFCTEFAERLIAEERNVANIRRRELAMQFFHVAIFFAIAIAFTVGSARHIQAHIPAAPGTLDEIQVPTGGTGN